MKVTFTYSDSPDIRALRTDEIFKTFLELPDAAFTMQDCADRVLATAKALSHFTKSCMHLTCKELNFVNYPIKSETTGGGYSLFNDFRALVIVFSSWQLSRSQHRVLRVLRPDLENELVPHNHLLSILRIRARSMEGNLIRPGFPTNAMLTETQQANQALLSQIVEHVLALLNSNVVTTWQYSGFNPMWTESRLITRHNRTSKRRVAEERRKEREEKKRAKEQERVAAQDVAQGKPTETFIYFVQAGEGGPIKIGFSANPAKRIASLSTAAASPLRILKIEVGSKQLEMTLHDRFSLIRMRGEWFKPTPELLAFIDDFQVVDKE